MRAINRSVIAAGALGVALSLGAAGLALADSDGETDTECPAVAKEQWASAAEVAAKAEAMGIAIEEIEADEGCWEVEGVDADGKEVELYLHPMTLDMVETEES